ncbi:MAG TPA: DUF998 domain-containing protein [Micromonosporaceae bacterium]|nr:DUF998 domain-containing protein [Micromonosporaceae bacterium]
MAHPHVVVTPSGQDARTVTHLRLGVGIIASALPFVVLFGNMLFAQKFIWLGSISGSYYTQMRGVFVGSLCAVGVFLISYRYDKLDNIASTIGGFLAIIVALFPTPPDTKTGHVTRTQVNIGFVHFTAATGLFLVLAFFCLWVFTRSAPVAPGEPPPPPPTAQKKARNVVYRTTGVVILLAVILAGLIGLVFTRAVKESWNTLFWCETVALLAFAISWLTKGGAFPWWNDPSPVGAAAPPQQAKPLDPTFTG